MGRPSRGIRCDLPLGGGSPDGSESGGRCMVSMEGDERVPIEREAE